MRLCAAYGSVPSAKAEADLHEVRLDVFEKLPDWLGSDCIVTLAGQSLSQVPPSFNGFVDVGDSKDGISFKKIRSVHDFNGTPTEDDIVSYLKDGEQEISKLACTVKSFTDLDTIYKASKRVSRPHILLGMGETGTVTRVRGDRLGNYLTFGYVGEPTAPGQLSLERLKELGPKCEVVGITGHPLGHSLSPQMQEAAMRSADISGIYLKFDSPDLAHMGDVMREYDIRGMNVTIPHKAAALQQADFLEKPAREIGAANTLDNEGGRITAANTDWEGIIYAFRKAGRPLEKCSLVLVYGTGGAARAAVYAAHEKGCDVRVLGRTPEHVDKICRDLGCEPADSASVRGCDALIQCTPVGMAGDEPYLFDPAELNKETAVLDTVYNRETALVRVAREKGCTIVSGKDMLVGQGASSFSRWFGIPADLRAMERAIQ
ncbi:MAG: type I 3-dehydroquinate dehydratase [Methanomethylophilus sp.]|jgi:3-dehydroquinate dehydratase/shikimate dehydrogenase